MTTTRLPENPCPNCGQKLDAATGTEEGTVPKPHDVTLCYHCLAPLIFTDDLGLRAMSDDEWIELPDDMRIELKRVMDGLKELRDAVAG